MEIRTVSLKDYSSLRIGGIGEMVEVRDKEELKEALIYAKREGLRIHILGQGTNSYFGEDLSKFLFIKLQFKGIEYREENECIFMKVQASEVWDDVVKESVEKGLWGIENLSFIPGTAGAAPVQNIGAYGVELADVFVSLSALDTDSFEFMELARGECEFGYRDSIFKRNLGKYIILSLTLKLYKRPRPVLTYKPLDLLTSSQITSADIRDVVIHTRTAKLPDWVINPNAGSFFKNPIIDAEVAEKVGKLFPSMPQIKVEEGYKIPSAWLIEYVAQMKGARKGNIGTWPDQPLVLVNYGNANAEDVDAFAQEIKKIVKQKTGVELEQEVNRVG